MAAGSTYHQLYRNTTLGNTLQESLDELIQSGMITPQLALKVLFVFDRCISQALAHRIKTRMNFHGNLKTYRFCDNVWTLVLNEVEFKDVVEAIRVPKVKIVACEGKIAKVQNQAVTAPTAHAASSSIHD